jgi:hypothetical protein
MCGTQMKGRSDKMFCSLGCKNEYHIQLRQVTGQATHATDKILHRNRSILLEVMGKNIKQKKIDRIVLDGKKFNYHYITGYYVNNRGKIYNYVYDFAWMIFSDKEVLIIKRGV